MYTSPTHRLPSVLACLLLLAAVPLARAQNDTRPGQFIDVRNPITSETVQSIRETTNRALSGLNADQRREFKLVYDFNLNNAAANSGDFGACLGLAKFISRELPDVKTIAFVHGEVTRHSVLPVLACREIVMSRDAKLGPIGQKDELDNVEKTAYQDLAGKRTSSPALIFKMYDKDMEVLEARKLMGAELRYIDARNEAEEAKSGIKVTNREPAIPRGTAEYTADMALRFGLCQHKIEGNTRADLTQAYGLPPGSLRSDPLMGRQPVGWKITLTGPVTPAMRESVERRTRQAISKSGRNANLIILQLECGGGGDRGLQAAIDLAEFFRTLRQDDREDLPVKTVAYIPKNAPDTAAVLALGCSEIIMNKDAQFGDFSAFIPAPEMRIETLKSVAKKNGYSPLLIQGMLDPAVAIYPATSKRGASEWKLLTKEEADRDRQAPAPRWDVHPPLKQAGDPFTLPAEKAKEVGLASATVHDTAGLYSELGVKQGQVAEASSDWLDDLAYFLRRTEVAVILVVLGLTCLILELKIPGVSLPGIIAAICFVLFFWAHSQLAGQITWLAVLLFVLGLILVGLELFVLPGVGIVGVSGTILLVLSLALVTLEKKPETTQEWLQFGSTIMTFALSLVGSVAAALVLAWWLPHIPYVNRVILKPPGEQEAGEIDSVPELTQPPRAALLGDIGVAATPLRPAGKVKFGDEFVDVVGEGGFVPEGTRVQVIEIEGNRIVVKEV